MKVKVSEASGLALDWMVERCLPDDELDAVGPAPYSTDWARGGPIIEREGITLIAGGQWGATNHPAYRQAEYFGPTPLIAAMRCFVASKLSDEVEVPDLLLESK